MRFRLRSVFAHRVRPVRPTRFRPELEPLDGRWVPSGFRQTNLVADEPGVARLTDPNLVDAWGMSFSSGSPFWLSAHGTAVSPLYRGDVGGSPLTSPFTVAIPGGAPTGQVFNTTTRFPITAGGVTAASVFIFASDAGTISGWNPNVPAANSRAATVAVSQPGASYTGLTLGTTSLGSFLYAADFKNGKIAVFDGSFAPATLPGNFNDPGIPERYVPFNVQNLGGKLYVTYARQDKDGSLSNGGSGFVSVFDLNGNFLMRLASGGHLKAPWGVAVAPAGFGEFGGAVLVGNHGNGEINAFDATTGRRLGKVRDESGEAIRIDGLFGLAFGNGVGAGDRIALYFAAGPNGGTDGLFGSLRFTPDAAASVAPQGLLLAVSPVTGPGLPTADEPTVMDTGPSDVEAAPIPLPDAISPFYPTVPIDPTVWIDPLLDLTPGAGSP